MKTFIILILIFLKKSQNTIDINLEELEYLANHLLPTECRKLVAAVHFKVIPDINTINEAELKISKDIPCLDLLLHWNSSPNEGKGETHLILEQGLRKLGKNELADWLAKTVFHQLGKDLMNELDSGLKNIINDTTTFKENITQFPIQPPIKDPTKWTNIDSIFFITIIILFLLLLGTYVKILFEKRLKKRSKNGYTRLDDENTLQKIKTNED